MQHQFVNTITDPAEARRRRQRLIALLMKNTGQVERVSQAQTTRPATHRISKPIQPDKSTPAPGDMQKGGG
jgi:hypothetical protein